MEELRIDGAHVIPGWELVEGFARSGGPGGQHVNRTESKVELRWWPASTAMRLTEGERARMLAALRPRLTDDGALVVTSSEERSQLRNRERAAEKLVEIVRAALAPRAVRRATRPSRSAKRRRLEEKRHVAQKKKDRRDGGE